MPRAKTQYSFRIKLAILLALFIPADAAPCGIRWNPNLPEDNVTHYRVWRGIDCLATVETNRAVVDLPTDQLSTLTVTATNESGESEHSDPITAIPVTPQHSEDLTHWTDRKPFFVEQKPSQFFRFKYPSSP